MRNNRLKLLSIAICCFVVALWSEAQCMDNQAIEQDRGEVRRGPEHLMLEARERLMDAKIGVDWWRNKSMNTRAAISFVSFLLAMSIVVMVFSLLLWSCFLWA